MLIGYVRVSKNDGSQTLAPQRDALLAAGVDERHLYEDRANGRLAFGIFAAFAEFERELIAERTTAGLAAARARGRMGGRPRKMDRATLTMAMAAMADPKAVAADVAKRLGVTTTTLYVYVNGDGTPKAPGPAVLDGRIAPGRGGRAASASPPSQSGFV